MDLLWLAHQTYPLQDLQLELLLEERLLHLLRVALRPLEQQQHTFLFAFLGAHLPHL